MGERMNQIDLVKSLPRPSRRYCKRILHEDNVELPVITVTLEWYE